MYLFGGPRGTWAFFATPRASVLFSGKLRCNLTYYESENFSDSSLYHSFEAESFRFPLWEEKVDEFSFLGSWPPTPPLRQHFALNKNQMLMLA